MSKYLPIEFFIGIRFYQGTRSPNTAEREKNGYSEAWLHHKGRNKHHFEYWIDYSLKDGTLLAGMPMPINYILEMFCDRIAASKIYKKELYTDGVPYEYFKSSRDHLLMHANTVKQLEALLVMLKEHGEDYTFSYIKNNLVN
jgi:hypothetical protein